MAKSLLIISRQAPWSGPSAREALDIVLAGGAFDLPLALLFLDDGVFQLVAQQNAKTLQQKDLSANLQALPMFGVEELFVCADSAAERGLAPSSLSLQEARVLTAQDVTALIDRYDQVITL
ncbi:MULTISPECIES: sulfurtransferase complex subunit TusC [unclassified Pseudomonas]|uniref:sulfurtransferase complex subunit TusC n=1 Tax=unclassified Pseudomonas TaxID=196821 RepID=UPI002AC95519|nr:MULTISPECIES: sulfurtransferase complex subunit TusC [unclassified Pseudomonas]MEB0046623.1 sulfurtransferase complex subunit TusC [Pseudomonas sp. Dout3]MEB0095389.1 sulfurtransferase complex subunit TusC [Pseudomonas sp. DC1.2]WPX60974.1 sulfurtransferase complex subunit TusC [Pseudomonas sp. DC1.2]